MILLPAEIEGIATRRDRTLKIVLGTNELSPSMSGDLFSLQNKVVFVAIKTAEFQKSEVEMLSKANDDTESQGKSQSERLRGVLFILWKQDNLGYTEFTDFYRFKTNSIIDHLKSKIK